MTIGVNRFTPDGALQGLVVLQYLRFAIVLPSLLVLTSACNGPKEPKIRFDAKTGHAKILYGNERELESVVAKPQLQAIDHATLGRIWLVKFSRSDSCPSEYIALMPGGRTSEIFGNCNDITEVKHEAEYLSLIFAEDSETQRAAEKVNLQ